MQVAFEPDVVLAELLRVEVIQRVPGQGPMRGGAEREIEAHLVGAAAAGDEGARGPERVGARAGAGAGVGDGEVEPTPGAGAPQHAARQRARAQSRLLPDLRGLTARLHERRGVARVRPAW